MWSNSLHFQWLLLLSLTKFRCSFSSWKVVGSWTNRLDCMCGCGRKDTSFHTKQPFWCDCLLTIYCSYQEDGLPHLILLSVCLVTRMLISTLRSFKLLIPIIEKFLEFYKCMRTPNVSNGKECWEKPEAEDAFIPYTKTLPKVVLWVHIVATE